MIEQNITYSKVMGSGPVVNKTIERFKTGEIKVLMLNASNYGSGLNLQMATDVIIYHQLSLELEVQVIGRAQRIGRIEPLNVYYLLHKFEQSNVTNPNLSLDLTVENDVEEFNKHLINKIHIDTEINTEIETDINSGIIKKTRNRRKIKN
jgi:ERCC4-related helicase